MKNLFQSVFALLLIVAGTAANAQTPVLSSYPSASAVILLDFDGHTVSGTSWNYNGPIVCDPSGLDETKTLQVFNRVAEDYRPFNINVTTDESKYNAAPANQRMRVIITVSSSWYGSAGGVAFVNSFKWGDNTPCFVFSALLNYNAKNIAEAASHEAGHTLGLYHQANYDANCVKISDYHQGTGSGEIGWAPIMGVGYYRNFTLWHNGPNSGGCNNIQSDLDVITAAGNGFGYRSDDHSSTYADATLANFTNNQFTINGVIERSADQDMIRFIMPADGRFELNAIPYNVGTGNSGSNLDMQVSLYSSTQTLLSIYNPGTLLSSVIDSTLNAGTYYLRIEGKGNLYAPEYASLGSYSLQGKFTAGGGTLPLHKLQLSGSITGDKHKLNWEIIADEPITKQLLEISTDGRNFDALTETAVDSRSFIYRPNTITTAQYRLQVTLDNGQQHYSNVVTLKQTGATPRPQLTGNLIRSSHILVNSPGTFSYQLFDMNGRMVNKGQLINGMNSISTAGLVNGMYMIRFANQNEQWTDKLIKQ